MKDKLSVLNIFLFKEDCPLFLNYLANTNTICIDIKPKETRDVCIVNKIDVIEKKDNTSYVLLNTTIQSLEEYANTFSLISGYHHYSQTGKGVIQFLPSYLPSYNKNCLMFGRLAASYNDDATHKWTKEIFSWLKRTGKKVYRVSVSPTRRLISDEAEKNMIALHDASNFYNGNNGHYLTLGKDIYCIAQ